MCQSAGHRRNCGYISCSPSIVPLPIRQLPLRRLSLPVPLRQLLPPLLYLLLCELRAAFGSLSMTPHTAASRSVYVNVRGGGADSTANKAARDGCRGVFADARKRN